MNIKLLSLCFSLILFASCGQQVPPQSDSEDHVVNMNESEVQVKNENLEYVLIKYLEVKDALVASDSIKAQSSGVELASALGNVKGCENTAKVARKIGDSDKLRNQREEFTLLSADIIPLITQSELSKREVFIQFCPMANNGNGGYWLASETEIRNPYYGDKMLKCGKVVEEFKQSSN